ncbi:MAG: hypothetical protein EON58_06450 [Alphaproteobacteria bacterium]|nr:MAG: hypothetical protein EON58_06450 [Alphaproteobacteria bacterium]
MHIALLAISLLCSAPPADLPVASLRVSGGQSSFIVKVDEAADSGYQISIDCIEGCEKAIHYRDTSGDTPLGLFSRDADGLVFSVWSGGSAYRVLVWALSDDGVRKVSELSSRARPDFMSSSDGNPMIQTYEGNSDTAPLRRVRWTFVDGHFLRSASKVR